MKRFFVGLLCCALLSAIVPTASLAAPGDPLAAAQQAMDARTQAAPGTGIILGYIGPDGVKILTSGSAGTARPLDQHTRFEVGSITKTFTANLLAQAVLAGSVKLTDPVAKYLPTNVHVPSRGGKQITLLNLAEQHSGLPRMPDNMRDVSGEDPYADYGVSAMYAFINGYTLTRDPGSKYEYSNLGIGLLGQALANQAHTSYAALVRRKIFAPLGMNESTVATAAEHDAALAVGHDAGGKVTHAWEFEALAGAGAVRSTMHDMLLYLRCNMGQGPLARDCLYGHQPRTTFPDGKIGLVWMTSRLGVVWHDGDTAGFHAMIEISADGKRGTVVLSNGPPVADIGNSVIEPQAPARHCPSAQPSSTASIYDGVYCDAGIGFGFTVKTTNSTTTLQVPDQPAFALKREKGDGFSIVGVAATVDFYAKAMPSSVRSSIKTGSCRCRGSTRRESRLWRMSRTRSC
jgi:CubicO group peptidase (beta-lactamase class C family)